MVALVCACSEEPEYRITEADARDYAVQRCRAEVECCATQDGSTQECEDGWVEQMLGYEDRVGEELVFSGSCMRTVLSQAGNLGCETELEAQAPPCRLAHGRGARGAPCVVFGDSVLFFGSNCAEGLKCAASICVDDPPPFNPQAQEGELCDSLTRCESGLFCGQQGQCQALTEAGQPCFVRNECGPIGEYYCRGYADGEGQCVAKAGLGEPCDPEELACEFLCEDGACEQLLCTDGVCARLGPAVCGAG